MPTQVVRASGAKGSRFLNLIQLALHRGEQAALVQFRRAPIIPLIEDHDRKTGIRSCRAIDQGVARNRKTINRACGVSDQRFHFLHHRLSALQGRTVRQLTLIMQ